jgi:hypothetical protein
MNVHTPERLRLSAIAAEIPTPVDEYGPARAQVGLQPAAGGEVARVYFGLDGGRRREWVGPGCATTDRTPYRLAELLNQRAGS